jgi:stringent starvation protein B
MSKQKVSSTKPYMIRALYEWCTDNHLSPQILIQNHKSCSLPEDYIDEDNEIALSLQWGVVKDLEIKNEYISVSVCFDGMTWFDVYAPMQCIKAIYPIETDEAIYFEIDEDELHDLPNYKDKNQEKSQGQEQNSNTNTNPFKRLK